MKDSSNEVKLGLQRAEVKLRSFLNSIRDIEGMEPAVKVAQRKLSVVKKMDPQFLRGSADYYEDGSSDSESFEEKTFTSSHTAKTPLQQYSHSSVWAGEHVHFQPVRTSL